MDNAMTLKDFFAARIREARTDPKVDMSQQDLAEKVGITLGAVSLWERAKSLPSAAHLLIVSLVTGKPITYFYPDEETARMLTIREFLGIPALVA